FFGNRRRKFRKPDLSKTRVAGARAVQQSGIRRVGFKVSGLQRRHGSARAGSKPAAAADQPLQPEFRFSLCLELYARNTTGVDSDTRAGDGIRGYTRRQVLYVQNV